LIRINFAFFRYFWQKEREKGGERAGRWSFYLALATAALLRSAYPLGASVRVVYVRKACAAQKMWND